MSFARFLFGIIYGWYSCPYILRFNVKKRIKRISAVSSPELHGIFYIIFKITHKTVILRTAQTEDEINPESKRQLYQQMRLKGRDETESVGKSCILYGERISQYILFCLHIYDFCCYIKAIKAILLTKSIPKGFLCQNTIRTYCIRYFIPRGVYKCRESVNCLLGVFGTGIADHDFIFGSLSLGPHFLGCFLRISPVAAGDNRKT